MSPRSREVIELTGAARDESFAGFELTGAALTRAGASTAPGATEREAALVAALLA